MNTVAKILLSAAELVIDQRQVTIYIGYGSGILNSELYNDEGEPVWEKHSTAEPWVAIEVAADSALPQCGRNATWAEREDREGRYGSLLRATQRAFNKCLDKTAGLIKPWPAPGVSIAPWGNPGWNFYIVECDKYELKRKEFISNMTLEERASLIRKAIEYVRM